MYVPIYFELHTPIIYTYTQSTLNVLLSMPGYHQGSIIKKDVENEYKIIEVKANIEKSAKKKMKRENKLHRSKMKALVKGHKKELLNHKVDSKQLEGVHAAELKKIDELNVYKIRVSSILGIFIFLS